MPRPTYRVFMKIILNKTWGTNRKGKVYDYPRKTAKYLVETVKVADYVEDEPVVIEPIIEEEDELPKKRRAKKSTYETKVLIADVE